MLLFIDYSSAFKTLTPNILISKLSDLDERLLNQLHTSVDPISLLPSQPSLVQHKAVQ